MQFMQPIRPPDEIQDHIDQLLDRLRDGDTMVNDPSFLKVTRWCEENEEESEVFGVDDSAFIAVRPEYEQLNDEALLANDTGLSEGLSAEERDDITDEMRIAYMREHFRSLIDEGKLDPEYHPACISLPIESTKGERAFLGLGTRSYLFTGVVVDWYGLFTSREAFRQWARDQGWLVTMAEFDALQPEQQLALWED